MEMTGGQALARQLVAEGVTDMFGIPGVQLDWATDALLDVADKINYYTPRHEQAASYMADGYARTTGKPGVCMVVPGPGLLNAMSGLATAYACSSPVLCITGQIPSATIGKGFGMLHEVRNQSDILGSVTKWHRLARTPQEIPALVHEAFVQMRTGQPRPVGIEIPPDVLAARADIELIPVGAEPARQAPDAKALAQLAGLLLKAKFPVIYAGGGVAASGAAEALRRLAETLQAPVVMTDAARGALPDGHPLALPNLGGRCVLPHADVILAVGTRFVDGMARATFGAASAQYAYLNVEAADMAAPRVPGLQLVGDARTGLELLVDQLEGVKPVSREREVALVRKWCDDQIALLEPQMSYIRALRKNIPANGILVSELTQVGYVSNFAYPVLAPRTLVTPGYQGTLGYGFATALGVSLGNPDKVVVSINGDGGFGWNLQELATQSKYQPNLITVVFADGAFGNVRRIQSRVFKREIGTTLHNPDFVKLAEAFGLKATRVTSPEELDQALQAAVKAGGPHFIEAQVSVMPGGWHLIHSFSPAPHAAPPNPLGDKA